MSQKKVVIASVLKPTNDTRMFEKFGLSLAATNLYDVNIIGFNAKPSKAFSNITFHPIYSFNRISFARLFSGFKFYKSLKKIAPQLIIITTHELLFPSVIYKLFHSSKVIYDVQENHYRNILFTNSFPTIIRPFLAFFVRLKEYMNSPFIDHFFLAEKYYVNEITFIKARFSTLENKCVNPTISSYKKEENSVNTSILFSGTLAKSTGVFEAIKLTKILHKTDSNIRLNIIGYSPKSSVINNILIEINNCSFIRLIGGNQLVDHNEILNEISRSDFGIINYPSNKSTINSTPTKLYEYLSCELPILIQKNNSWKNIWEPITAGVEVDFNEINAVKILSLMRNTKFYPDGVGEQFLWKSEEPTLLNITSSLTH